jgi:hypothetical protein
MPLGFGTKSSADDDDPSQGIFQRLRKRIVQPGATGYAPDAVSDLSPEELVAQEGTLNERERIIGLIAAPLAALVGLIITNANIDHDPAQFLSNGSPNPKYTSVGLYHELLLVLLGLALLMIVMSFLRKRMFLGMVMALYGLAVFNLHYWGFGVPFILGGAWYLVRAYRLSQGVKKATGGTSRYAPGPSGNGPRPSKRYTPPVPGRRRPSKPKPELES